jgi:hypothetical protein
MIQIPQEISIKFSTFMYGMIDNLYQKNARFSKHGIILYHYIMFVTHTPLQLYIMYTYNALQYYIPEAAWL